MSKTEFNKSLARGIKKAQAAAGMDDRELAYKVRCTERELQEYKAGNRTMRVSRFLLIAEVLNVEPTKLAKG